MFIVSQDVKELRLTANPAFRPDASKAGDDALISPYICPVTGLEMNGRYKCVLQLLEFSSEMLYSL